MGRAEVGSTKWQANKMKSKGLQRLRWYCEPCKKQCRDENGYKCHTQSESHVRTMVLIGEDPRKAINEYSQQFLRDFLLLLRTAHGEKKINLNHFYQTYIANKEHIHMNATKWPSLTEFGKYLGREGICRVSEDEKGHGLCISWIDNSPEALRRQDAIRKKERQEKGDEEREQRMIQEQVEKARAEAKVDAERHDEETQLQRKEGEKIQLNLKPSVAKTPSPPQLTGPSQPPAADAQVEATEDPAQAAEKESDAAAPAAKPAFSMGLGNSKPKNVFSSKKNPLASKKVVVKEQPKKMSEAERIMREEMERKRLREGGGPAGGAKRQRIG
ncbi:Zinc finger C2H2-type protein [Lasiodiplodia theobromae]|uniref:KIN17-like protein n=1 Tax=Lasiodiplodia theobromae TaxID=45133 RepID=A0A5N5DFW3_9PEZI|nr:Zinc finger C2H2-type protein [Lasiodiplodia theobromae]KAB2576537.1 KIN17-like protein [Lasiodiplodia theobromae]KAF4546597.1 Zinc finger C2H2-type protein [Lasiodiplodia theobromae]